MANASNCPWCGTPQAGGMQCAACGAPLDQPMKTTESGWTQLPPLKDMTQLHFSRSSCQIAGDYVPMADVLLSGDDSIYFAHHVLLWKDDAVEIGAMSLRGGWKRLFAGLPVVMTQTRGAGHVAFSHDAPGEIVALPLQPGHTVDVREHLFLLASQAIDYDWFPTNVWFTTGSGNDQETLHPVGQFMDRFTAGQSPGLLLLHAPGNVFVRHLAQGETMLIKPTALLFKSPTVHINLHIEAPRQQAGFLSYKHRTLWLSLTGPGRIAVHSAYSRLEDNANAVQASSPCSYKEW